MKLWKFKKHDIDVNRVKEMAANMGIKLMEE